MAKAWFFSFSFLLLMSSLMLSSATPKNNFSDENALLAFKTHITSDPLNILQNNWSTATSFCYWFGVSCSSRHSRVVALDLSNLYLEGTIPPDVGNLSFLASINLSNNSFHGALPDEFARLRRLKYINLAVNDFAGEIPSGFGVLTNLQQLILFNNSFAGRIPVSIFNITTLENLELRGNFLQGNIPEEIGNLSSVWKITMGYNLLSGSIPPVIFNMSSLLSFSVPSNNFSGTLQANLCNIQSKLRLLTVGINRLSGPIPSDLHRCAQLDTIGFERNNFTGSIPRELGNLTDLNWVSMFENRLTGSIPPEFGGLHKLQRLYLADNYLEGPIPSSIFNLSMAEKIELTGNQLSGPIPSNIGLRTPYLWGIYLLGNELNGSIPDSISNASQLIELELGHNLLSGYIPESLGKLRPLQYLGLAGNSLTTRNPFSESNFLSKLTDCKNLLTVWVDNNPLNIKLPPSIGNLSASLQLFSAKNCKVRGEIPSEIGNLSSLTGLTLENNELSGNIPTTIGRLTNLQGLSLAANKLEGSIPLEICNLKRLLELHLMENNLTGSIPPCSSNLTSLSELFLSSNQLNGTIPSTLWNLAGILKLNLSSNSITGSLPGEIQNLGVAEEIDLSRNSLSGDIPTTIGSLQNLVHLSLSANRLQGDIPQSVGDLPGLEFLDLSNNNLSGQIPKSLEKLNFLKYFNVSFNQLEGEIPEEGSFSNFSSESFTGNKALCGPSRLQVPPCPDTTPPPSRTRRRRRMWVFKYMLPATGFILLIASIIILRRYRKRAARIADQGNLLPLQTMRRISYHELEVATNGFEESNLLGSGSFGSVYKGTLSDGLSVAVKVFDLRTERAFKSFDTECEALRNLRHRNLVKIISSCSNLEFKALVLDFMPNWSLEKWLYAHNYFLDTLQRLNVMIDVAAALDYLHHGYHSSVVHCDLKPSNILLNQDMLAHLSDFGIAKLLGEGNSMMHTITLATIGYMAPEYGSEGIVSTRGDMYSYGILVMETFTRKKPTDEMFAGDEMNLKNWVKQYLYGEVSDEEEEVIDGNLVRREDQNFGANEDCINSIMKLALECCADLPEHRMDIQDALTALNKIKAKFLKDCQLSQRQR